MKFKFSLPKTVLGLLAAALLLPAASAAGPAEAADPKCRDVADRGHLNVLTLNLLFSEIENRDARFGLIADFVEAEAALGEPVDLLLLQEVVGGALVGTGNSAEDLRDILRARGLNYDLRTAFETGLPGVLATANAILSRCEITAHLAAFLPLTSETIELGDLEIPVSRNIMMVRIKIPDFRRVNIYNTHFCAGDCTVDELDEQTEEAIDFVDGVERLFSFFRRRPHILGGDLNLDNFRGRTPPEVFGPEYRAYKDFTRNDFEDAYAEAQAEPLSALCEDPQQPDVHCTVDVSALDDGNTRRIDYVFSRGFGAVIEGKVVFNPVGRGGACDQSLEPECASVSDHAGVLARIRLSGGATRLSAAE